MYLLCVEPILVRFLLVVLPHLLSDGAFLYDV